MTVCLSGHDRAPPEVNPGRQPRSSIFVAAAMRSGTEQAPVRIRNMSPNGARVESAVSPSVGSQVDLSRGALLVRGTVVWSSANCCGLRFDSAVSVKDWLAAPTKVQQQRVDDMVALVKAGGASVGPDTDTPAQPRSFEQLANDLQAVVRLMQDLEDDLASSDETLGRHGTKLQNLDIAMQMVRAVSGELTSGDGRQPLDIARLKDLRVTCSQALGTD